MKKIGLSALSLLLAIMLTGCLGTPGAETTQKRETVQKVTTAAPETTKAVDTTVAPETTNVAGTTLPETTQAVTTAEVTTDPCAKGHALSVWTRVAEPTTETEGREERRCANCDYTETRVVPKKIGLKPLEKEERYGRATLAASGNSAVALPIYDAIVECLSLCEARLDTVAFGVDYATFKAIYNSVVFDYPDYFWVESGFSYALNSSGIVTYVEPVYNMKPDEVPTAALSYAIAAAGLLAGLDGSMGEYELARVLHDRLVATCVYDSTHVAPYTHSAYGTLVYHTSVCEGYARSYQYLLTRVGIKSAIVTGRGGDEDHAWNYVCIDGKYYPVDVTWDDPGGIEGVVSYEYFCPSVAEFSLRHVTGEDNYALPACEEQGAGYYRKIGTVATLESESLLGAIRAGYENDLREHFSILLEAPATIGQVKALLDVLDYQRLIDILHKKDLTSFRYSLSTSGRILFLQFE